MENNIDKLFKSKLGDDITPYDPAAWGRMAALIDEDDDVSGGVIRPPKNRWKIYFGLTLLLMISLIGFWQFRSNSNTGVSMKNTTQNDKESWSALNSEGQKVDLSSVENIGVESNRKSVIQKSENAESSVLNSNSSVSTDVANQFEENSKLGSQKSSSIDNKMNFNSKDDVQFEKDRLNDENKKNRFKKENYGPVDTSTERNNESIEGNQSQQSEDSVKGLPTGNNFINSNINKEDSNSQNSNQNSTPLDYDKEENFKSNSTRVQNVKSDQILVLNPTVREEVTSFPFLNTSTQELVPEYKEILPLSVQLKDNSRMKVSVFSRVAYNENFISRSGVSVEYHLNSLWSLTTGVGIEYANYNDGRSITVQDKLYSFGSTLVDRDLVLNKRTAAILPIMIRRRIGRVAIDGGISFNYHLAGNGDVVDGDGNISSIWISNDSFKPISLSYTLGTAYSVSRRFEINCGIIYRTNKISTNVISGGTQSKLYPQLGISYNFVKL